MPEREQLKPLQLGGGHLPAQLECSCACLSCRAVTRRRASGNAERRFCETLETFDAFGSFLQLVLQMRPVNPVEELELGITLESKHTIREGERKKRGLVYKATILTCRCAVESLGLCYFAASFRVL